MSDERRSGGEQTKDVRAETLPGGEQKDVCVLVLLVPDGCPVVWGNRGRKNLKG